MTNSVAKMNTRKLMGHSRTRTVRFNPGYLLAKIKKNQNHQEKRSLSSSIRMSILDSVGVRRFAFSDV